MRSENAEELLQNKLIYFVTISIVVNSILINMS